MRKKKTMSVVAAFRKRQLINKRDGTHRPRLGLFVYRQYQFCSERAMRAHPCNCITHE